jgi:hypothetical protein
VTGPTPDNPYATSSYAKAARERKAISIETALRLGGFDSEHTALLTPEQRRQVERAAGTRPASDATWDLVLRFMRDAEQRPAPPNPKEEVHDAVPAPTGPRRPGAGHTI